MLDFGFERGDALFESGGGGAGGSGIDGGIGVEEGTVVRGVERVEIGAEELDVAFGALAGGGVDFLEERAGGDGAGAQAVDE
ncbi:MAG: hypothetical protein AB7G11_16145 [Phycisphaerales bacterium]